MAGARLSEADKTRLKKLNEEDASLSAKFMNQARGRREGRRARRRATRPSWPDCRRPRLTRPLKRRRRASSTGKWLLPLMNTTQQPLLESLSNRATREQLFNASWTRAERGDANDTRATITRLAEIRADKAKLLGSANFAAWRLQDQMAKTPRSGAAVSRQSRARRHGQGARGSRGHPDADRPAAGRIHSSSRGTGTSTPSRCARRSSTWTTTRSSRTSS